MNSDLARLLRLPTGESVAVAQRFLVTWDRRDNSFNAHRGTFESFGVEHVDWNALGPLQCPTADRSTYQRLYYGAEGWTSLANSTVVVPGPCDPSVGHTLRFTQTFSAYLPITKKITLAGEIRLGLNVQLTSSSTTYPDRLFFMGGIDSMRGYLQDTFVPQDLADLIQHDFSQPYSNPNKYTIADVALRGGNLMINPRLELRIPIYSPIETVIFFDSGNTWSNPLYPFGGNPSLTGQKGFNLPLRTAVGTGLRLQTPIGPVVFDYGINLSRLIEGPSNPRYTYEDFGAFHFAIGLF